MRRLLAVVAIVILAFSCAVASSSARAQDKTESATDKPARAADAAQPERNQDSYRVDYVITESEGGKKIDSRSYTVMTGNRRDHRGSLRIGSRIPVSTASSSSAGSASWQYLDVGVNIDSSLDTLDNSLHLYSDVEMSSLAEKPEQSTPGQVTAPVVRQFKLGANSVVTPGKPTIIGTADDVATHRHFEVQATVTKVGKEGR
jgi:hypothetical protein